MEGRALDGTPGSPPLGERTGQPECLARQLSLVVSLRPSTWSL